jgi:hypothetical protein
MKILRAGILSRDGDGAVTTWGIPFSSGEGI